MFVAGSKAMPPLEAEKMSTVATSVSLVPLTIDAISMHALPDIGHPSA